ncbi:MAG TPA: hypothetical protein VMX16_10945 [Terriglobia bacterium]|nr:hypothetical protein [Terriglobia bacterium]
MELGELKIPKIEIQRIPLPQDFRTRLVHQYFGILDTEFGRDFVQRLGKDLRVIALNDKMISNGYGASRFDVKHLAMWSLWCANEYGSERAESCLNSFLQSEEISAVRVLWVLGVQAADPIALKDGHFIQPIETMPDSSNKELFLQHPFTMAPLWQSPATSACAITKQRRLKKVWPSGQPESEVQESWADDRRMKEIALLLNALDGVCCMPCLSTGHVEPTVPFGPFGGSASSSQLYDVVGWAMSRSSLSSVSAQDIDALMDSYDRLEESKKTGIQTILSRLSQAKRRTQIEDKILDLGIALEMLLLKDQNDNNDQLSLTFRLRGSWLLADLAEERIEIFKLLKEIYKYRSQVAHGGVLCKGNAAKIAVVRQSFPKYQSLGERVCRKIIRDGKPDWDKTILGARS